MVKQTFHSRHLVRACRFLYQPNHILPVCRAGKPCAFQAVCRAGAEGRVWGCILKNLFSGSVSDDIGGFPAPGSRICLFRANLSPAVYTGTRNRPSPAVLFCHRPAVDSGAHHHQAGHGRFPAVFTRGYTSQVCKTVFMSYRKHQSGMLPCFLGGLLWFLLRDISSARINLARVSRGMMISSTRPRSAAR